MAKAGHHASDDAAARKLAEELGYLPLALEQAASFILKLRWSFDTYRERLHNARPKLLSHQSEGGTRYPASVAKTWSISLERLGPLARALLRLAAWFAPDGIPRRIFLADPMVFSEALGESVDASELAIEEALGELDRFSLIRLSPETVSVHRLLQAVEQDSLTTEERQRWRWWAIRIFTTEAERKHLLNLVGGRTSNYQGRHSLRSELRRLRWMRLLAMKPGRNVGDIKDGLSVNLADYVYLTYDGRDWVEVIRKAKEAAKDPTIQPGP